MPEKVMPGPVEDQRGIREAVCIHTRKIYDSCRDKDCIEDLRFYPKLPCVDVINRALSVKGGSARLLYRLCGRGARQLPPGVLHGGYAVLLRRDPSGLPQLPGAGDGGGPVRL